MGRPPPPYSGNARKKTFFLYRCLPLSATTKVQSGTKCMDWGIFWSQQWLWWLTFCEWDNSASTFTTYGHQVAEQRFSLIIWNLRNPLEQILSAWMISMEKLSRCLCNILPVLTLWMAKLFPQQLEYGSNSWVLLLKSDAGGSQDGLSTQKPASACSPTSTAASTRWPPCLNFKSSTIVKQVIYGFMSRNFRQSFSDALCSCRLTGNR